MATASAEPAVVERTSLREVFWYFLKLGWLAFGGPVGQIGLMHLEVVERRQWIERGGVHPRAELLPRAARARGAAARHLHRLARSADVPRRASLAGILFILPGFITLTALAWIYVRFGKRPEVLGVLWGFRPVGLALLARRAGAHLPRRAQGVVPGRAGRRSPSSRSIFAHAAVHRRAARLRAWCSSRWRKLGRALRAAGAAARRAAPAPATRERGEPLSRAAPRHLLVLPQGRPLLVRRRLRGAALHPRGRGRHLRLDHRPPDDRRAGAGRDHARAAHLHRHLRRLPGRPRRRRGPGSGAIAATFWLFLPSFVFVLGAARYMDWLTSRPGVKEFLKGVTSGVVGLMFSISIPLAKVAFMPERRDGLGDRRPGRGRLRGAHVLEVAPQRRGGGPRRRPARALPGVSAGALRGATRVNPASAASADALGVPPAGAPSRGRQGVSLLRRCVGDRVSAGPGSGGPRRPRARIWRACAGGVEFRRRLAGCSPPLRDGGPGDRGERGSRRRCPDGV